MTTMQIGTGERNAAKATRNIEWSLGSDGTLTVQGKPVAFASLEFVVAYGLRKYIADGAASSKTADEFTQATDERIRKILEADFARTKSEPGQTNDPEVLAAQLSRADYRAAIKAKGGDTAAKYKALDADAKAAAWEKSVFGPNGTKWQTYLDRAADEIKKRAKMAEGVNVDDLGL